MKSFLCPTFIYTTNKEEWRTIDFVVHILGLRSVDVNVKQALWLWDSPLQSGDDTQAQRQWAASELDLKRRYFLNAIRLRELERGGLSPRTAASLPNQEIYHFVILIYWSFNQSVMSFCNSKGTNSVSPGDWCVAHHFNSDCFIQSEQEKRICALPQLPSFWFSPTVLLHFPRPLDVPQPNFHVVPLPRLQWTAVLRLTAEVNSRCHKPTLNGSRSWTRWKRRPRCWPTAAGSGSAPLVQPAPPSRLTCHPCGGKSPLVAVWGGAWLIYSIPVCGHLFVGLSKVCGLGSFESQQLTCWPCLYRGESLDNLDARSSWRSSWTPRSNSYIPNYNQLPSAFSGSAVNYGGGSGVQRPGAGTPSSLSSQQSRLPSPLSPTRSPEPRTNTRDSLQRNRYYYNSALLSNSNKLPLTS